MPDGYNDFLMETYDGPNFATADEDANDSLSREEWTIYDTANYEQKVAAYGGFFSCTEAENDEWYAAVDALSPDDEGVLITDIERMLDVAYMITLELLETDFFNQFYPVIPEEPEEPELYCSLLSERYASNCIEWRACGSNSDCLFNEEQNATESCVSFDIGAVDEAHADFDADDDVVWQLTFPLSFCMTEEDCNTEVTGWGDFDSPYIWDADCGATKLAVSFIALTFAAIM